ncbi:carbohydrate esterase family 4 protein [Infundibulicybe gibba]|nr:carbohydrate esterase family 4 protein [Infundibulicybe gibba]
MFFTALFLLPLAFAASIPPSTTVHDHNHDHDIQRRLPTSWYHSADHPVHALFKRAPSDGIDYAPLGSPAWSAGFPAASPNPSQLPAAWVDALNTAVAAGKIPDIPRSSGTAGNNPVYPAGTNPTSPEVCSATYKCRNVDDLWDAPDGVFGSSFDDGPQPSTTRLVQFLDSHNETTTHFMIGINIIANPQQFGVAFNSNNDIAVHTWTHPYMTTLTNLDILGQLGWTMELIHNSTGGRVPKYWRPPYGDSDNRVRAVAKEVFGLETVIWNQDTRDWSISTNGTTAAAVNASMQQWLTGPKSPGLIILEHEINDQCVQLFMDAYPVMKSNGWKMVSVSELAGSPGAYQNSADSESDVKPAGIILGSLPSSVPSSSKTSPRFCIPS